MEKSIFKKLLIMNSIGKIVFLFLALLGVCSGAVAENYPYRSDYLWVTVPDHADWLYKTGEKPVVDVQLYKYGMPVTCDVSYEICDDMLAPDSHGTARIKDGRCRITMDTRRTPGFRDLILTAKVDGKECRHHIKLGFDVDRIRPYTQEPADFVAFWQENIDRMRRQRLEYSIEDAPEYSTDKMTCRLVKLQVAGGHSVYSYLFVPKGRPAGSCPIVVCPPGAGIKTIKEPLRHRYYGEGGCIRLEMEIHGLDPRMPKGKFDEISRAFNPSNDAGYLSLGMDNRDRYYMKNVYLALVRVIDFATELPEWDGENVVMQGGSQGGALSLVAAALDKRVTQCVVNHPALSDMAAYMEKGRTGGYPHFNAANGTLTANTVAVLAYYDVVNFARHISCPVYMTWGYNDITCPPTTSYAVWNTLHCQKEALITPVNEHWTSDATEYGQYEWIMRHLKKKNAK